MNQSPERQYKYGEVLTPDMNAEDVITKLKSETTQDSQQGQNIFGNLESGLLDV